MQDPNRLLVTPRARKLATLAYRATASFPHDERLGLTLQMRRAAVSIGSNICEGCGKRTDRELLASLYTASGSLHELEFQAIVATDLEFGSADALRALLDAIVELKKMLTRLIVAIERRTKR